MAVCVVNTSLRSVSLLIMQAAMGFKKTKITLQRSNIVAMFKATDSNCYGLLHCIHVNPPSFVRSLRHFGIAENLRPGDENLRHLTVASRFKKKLHIGLSLAINSENATYCSRLFNIFLLRGYTTFKVGQIIMWLARTRD